MITKYLRKLKNYEPILVEPSLLTNQHSLNKSSFSLNGDWDTLTHSITNGYIYKSFQKRLEGVDWKSTRLYQRKYKKGERWLRKLKVWDSMLQDITTNGYTQHANRDKIDEYISILIGRHGHMFIYNGIHRLVCCLLSDKDTKIPVKVLLRHTDWATFKRQCEAYAKRRGSLYCQLPHPDLESIPYYWTNERAECIADVSIFPGGHVMDIGAHWGTTSFIMAKNNFICTAIEKSKVHFNKLIKVSRFPRSGFSIANRDFTKSPLNADIGIFLNIAHHFILDKEKQKRFFHFLSLSKFNEVFYQSHRVDDKWASTMSPGEMLENIKSLTGLKSHYQLADFNGRKLWHLV